MSKVRELAPNWDKARLIDLMDCVSDSTSAITGVGKFIREKLDGLDLSDEEADNVRSCQWCGRAILYSDRFCSQTCEDNHKSAYNDCLRF